MLDKGFVELDGAFASDLAVVNAARASFDTQVKELDSRDEGLIRYLMHNKHASPFEHGQLRFRVKAPLFVVREWQRHRTGSFNEESGRYSTLKREFYYPWGRVRRQTGKPGAYTFERVDEALDMQVSRDIAAANNYAWQTYTDLLDKGIAREVARMVLPLNTYSTFVWSVNPRNLLNFLVLRNSPEAQEEIREYAQAVEKLFAPLMPLTYAAWDSSDRTAL